MTIVKVATGNPQKIIAIKKAFQRYFENVKILSFEVESGVPSQPLNEEVYEGAKNRIKELKKVDNAEYDYLVACEGGMIFQYGNWFNLQVVQVERKDGKIGIGLSQAFQVPTKYVEEVRMTSISKVFKRLFGDAGGVSILTLGEKNRKDLIEDGTIMALARVLNDAW